MYVFLVMGHCAHNSFHIHMYNNINKFLDDCTLNETIGVVSIQNNSKTIMFNCDNCNSLSVQVLKLKCTVT